MGPVTLGVLTIVGIWILVAVVIWSMATLGADATVQRIVKVVLIVIGVAITLFMCFRLAGAPLALP